MLFCYYMRAFQKKRQNVHVGVQLSWLEHLPCKQGVSGSNPLTSTTFISGTFFIFVPFPNAKQFAFRKLLAHIGLQLSWLEHHPDKVGVGGSSPLNPTKFESEFRSHFFILSSSASSSSSSISSVCLSLLVSKLLFNTSSLFVCS